MATKKCIVVIGQSNADLSGDWRGWIDENRPMNLDGLVRAHALVRPVLSWWPDVAGSAAGAVGHSEAAAQE